MLEQSTLTAEELMSRDVKAVRPDSPLLTAVRKMADHHISGLVVVDDDNRPVGMLTEGDLLRWHGEFTERQAWWLDHLADGMDLAPSFMDAIRSQQRKVSKLMSVGVVSVTPETGAGEIARLFFERKIKRVPVVRDGKLVGLVSRGDLLQALARELAEGK
jgi:CBS domain-containing protein